MSVDEAVYTTTCCRTLASLNRCGQLPASRQLSERLGSKYSPHFKLEPHHLVVDILQLMLWVMDVLLRNLIFKMAKHDLATRKRGARDNIDSLVAAVRSIGVSFAIWQSRNSNGRVQQGSFECTALGGTDLLKVLCRCTSGASPRVPCIPLSAAMAGRLEKYYQCALHIHDCTLFYHEF